VISDALGLSVPHLNRMMAKLRADRLIALAERRVDLLDLEGLRRLAHFQPARLARIPLPPEPSQEFPA
jgi:hypothetical protein